MTHEDRVADEHIISPQDTGMTCGSVHPFMLTPEQDPWKCGMGGTFPLIWSWTGTHPLLNRKCAMTELGSPPLFHLVLKLEVHPGDPGS